VFKFTRHSTSETIIVTQIQRCFVFASSSFFIVLISAGTFLPV